MGLELVHIERVVKKMDLYTEMRCYEALRKIKAVLEDESLTDAHVFRK